MKQVLSLLVRALFAASSRDGLGSVMKRPGKPDVVHVEAEDPLMSAAIKKPVSTLTEF